MGKTVAVLAWCRVSGQDLAKMVGLHEGLTWRCVGLLWVQGNQPALQVRERQVGRVRFRPRLLRACVGR